MQRSLPPPVDAPHGMACPPLETSAEPPALGPAAGQRTVLRSTDLLGSLTAIEIEHKGQLYRLQATRSGKLILTK